MRAVWILLVSFVVSLPALAQVAKKPSKASHKSQPKKSQAAEQPGVKLATGPAFVPTCNLDSNSVGFYFFPANLGAKWTVQTVQQIYDAQSRLLKSDTTYSYERVISDTNRSIQGLPILLCASSYAYKEGFEDSAKTKDVEYYVDDSTVIAVFNHSVSSGLSHIMLINPLHLGAEWRDDQEDTIHSKIIALDEPVTTVLGTFPHALVVQSRLGYGELSKFFVKGKGMVKSVYRGISPQQNGSFVVTSELVKLDEGDPKRSIKYRFPQPVDERYEPHLVKPAPKSR